MGEGDGHGRAGACQTYHTMNNHAMLKNRSEATRPTVRSWTTQDSHKPPPYQLILCSQHCYFFSKLTKVLPKVDCYPEEEPKLTSKVPFFSELASEGSARFRRKVSFSQQRLKDVAAVPERLKRNTQQLAHQFSREHVLSFVRTKQKPSKFVLLK